MNSNLDLYRLALSFVPNIGAVSAKSLISYCGGIEAVFSASKKQLMAAPGIGERRALDFTTGSEKALKKAEAELRRLQGRDIELIFYLDEQYPKKLRNYEDSPLLLYKKGNFDLEIPRTVAIVGTRKVTQYGILQCEKLVSGLKDYGCTIISGLAHGVDKIAHRKSVELNIPTIGVLGHGMNNFYPAANRELAGKMMKNGGILSEYSLETNPDRENFPKRNRVIASLADVIVIVESARTGGSMITAEYANNYHKDVFAIPGRSGDAMSEGCNLLIKSHRANLCDGVHDIAYIMRWDKATEGTQMELVLELEPDEKILMDLIRETPNIGLDTLHYKTKKPLAQITTLLLSLEFKGLIKPLPGKKYILAR